MPQEAGLYQACPGQRSQEFIQRSRPAAWPHSHGIVPTPSDPSAQRKCQRAEVSKKKSCLELCGKASPGADPGLGLSWNSHILWFLPLARTPCTPHWWFGQEQNGKSVFQIQVFLMFSESPEERNGLWEGTQSLWGEVWTPGLLALRLRSQLNPGWFSRFPTITGRFFSSQMSRHFSTQSCSLRNWDTAAEAPFEEQEPEVTCSLLLI